MFQCTSLGAAAAVEHAVGYSVCPARGRFGVRIPTATVLSH